MGKLRRKYGTFQSLCVGLDRIGRKKYNSRVGLQTELEDTEISLWRELVKKTIAATGKKPVQLLLVWVSTHKRMFAVKKTGSNTPWNGILTGTWTIPAGKILFPLTESIGRSICKPLNWSR